MSENRLKYPAEVITNIAQEVAMGMICFLNPDTMEYDSVMGKSYELYWTDKSEELYQEVYNKVESWKHFIRIEPPESRESFKMMERFIQDCIPDNEAIKSRLWYAMSNRKPFQNFKFLIDNSKYRQRWFEFKQSQLEQYVLEQLS